jgi:hypothetical protein
MILDETRERFIKAIAKQVDPARIAEIHFFAPIRQGGVESGVAVIAAAERLPDPSMKSEEEDLADDDDVLEAAEDDVVEAAEDDVADAAEIADEMPPSDEPLEEPPPSAPAPIERHVIYTARYRLTLKGPDRGKWEAHVTAEADAPIITVDAVVRGVQRRAGDVDDPTRMSGDEMRAALPAAV